MNLLKKDKSFIRIELPTNIIGTIYHNLEIKNLNETIGNSLVIEVIKIHII